MMSHQKTERIFNMFQLNKWENRICRRILSVLSCSILLAFSFVFHTVALAEADLQTPWAPDSYEIHLLLNSDLILTRVTPTKLSASHIMKQKKEISLRRVGLTESG